jgi:hypothetical protein
VLLFQTRIFFALKQNSCRFIVSIPVAISLRDTEIKRDTLEGVTVCCKLRQRAPALLIEQLPSS